MITLSCRPCVRALILGMAMLCLASVGAQPPGRGSLTEDFPGMSAKERSRIAKQEEGEAKADTAYQRMMASGEVLFQQQRYEEALAAYKEARARRPYNVYPKVKIQDLEAFLDQRRKAEEAAAPAPLSPPRSVEATAPPQKAPDRDTSTVQVRQEPEPRAEPGKVAQVRVAPQATNATPQAAPLPAPKPAPVQAAAAPPPSKDGMQEREYKEGNAFVMERTVTQNGHATVYRKVVHSWATYYFMDGKPIDERVWKERFAGR